MLFNSVEFLIFFPTVVTLYFLCPQRYRWLLLLAASYLFYAAWRVEYALLLLFSTVVDFFVARAMDRVSEPTSRRRYLALSLAVNLGVLFTFKYFNFFNDSLRSLFSLFAIDYQWTGIDVLLPVGISFYTFQSLSYIFDVYRGKLKAEQHFGIFALYVAFFPQLVAGPIERAAHMLPQFRVKHLFYEPRVNSGLRLILWGLFKKVVIADRLAVYVNQVYNNPTDYTGWPLLMATYFFAFQIYCDFSGYSDIAIGAARIMGFDLMQNFRQPYMARSVAGFWRRWHISLSTWFRDYLYIPLGGNRVAPWRWYLNLAIVFLVSGLWHGARWTFVIWGALHAFYILMELWLGQLRARRKPDEPASPPKALLPDWLQIVITFHLVLFSWIFFRANSLSDAWLILQKMGQLGGAAVAEALYAPWLAAGVADAHLEMALSVGLILVLELIQWFERYITTVERSFVGNPRWLRWVAYVAMAIAITNLGVAIDTPFIYFQF
ncbi:MAG: MBOAT family protein [Caldilineaceae bacterium]|nr:MBOAT family protein [Caldilineaceae bacterium]